MRILIEGADLTGKSTLTEEVGVELKARQIDTIILRGRTGWSLSHPLLKDVDYSKHARSGWLNSLYLILSVFDRFFLVRKPNGGVVLHDSYIDRAIAYGLALRLRSAAPIFSALRWIFPKFDFACLLIAKHETRLDRFHVEEEITENDRLILDPNVHDRFQGRLISLIGRQRAWVMLPTDSISSQDLAVLVADNIEARLK